MFTIAEERNYHDGEMIYDEGSLGNTIYLVRSGAVTISKKVYGETMVIEVMRSGDIFGEMAFLTGRVRVARATALGETILGMIDTSELRRELNSTSPELQRIVTNVAKRLETSTECSSGIEYIRKEPRILKTFQLSYKKNNTYLQSYSHDASCGGLFIKTDEPLGIGQQFLLQLTLPHLEERLKVKCQVAWTRLETSDSEARPLGMGVKFVQIGKEDYEKLQVALPKC